jgi:hypothetical protein
MDRATALAAARAPASLDEFRTSPLEPADGAIRCGIACACGGPEGEIISEFGPEEDFWADPLVFECCQCGRSATFFDSSRHGYDPVLNAFSATIQRTRDERVPCKECNGRRHSLVGAYRFEFEDEEIDEEWSEAQRSQMPDLFSSVSFSLTCAGCGVVQRLADFECA